MSIRYNSFFPVPSQNAALNCHQNLTPMSACLCRHALSPIECELGYQAGEAKRETGMRNINAKDLNQLIKENHVKDAVSWSGGFQMGLHQYTGGT